MGKWVGWGRTCLALPSIPRLGPLPGFLVTARRGDTRLPNEADLSWWPRSGVLCEPRASRAGGPESSLGQWSCPLLGSLLEPRESPDLRSGWLRPISAPLALQLRHRPPSPIQPRCSPLPPQFQNSLFADIYSTLPQPGSLPCPGQCGGKSGSPPPERVGVLSPPPRSDPGLRIRPAPRQRQGPRPRPRRSPGSGVGKAGAEASHPQPRGAREVCRGAAHKAQPQNPRARGRPLPRPGSGKWGVEGMRLCPPGPQSSAEQPGWGRGCQS